MTKTPTILAIETATSNCSVALQYADGVICRAEDGNNVHSKVLLSLIAEVLQEAGIERSELDAVAVGQGPGSFTGLRIGVGVAQGLAYGVGCPMIGISSLDALANLTQSGPDNQLILAGIDARMGEVYWCKYLRDGDGLHRQSELAVTPPEDIDLYLSSQARSDAGLRLHGNAWSVYSERLSESINRAFVDEESLKYPTAESVLDLAVKAYARGEFIAAVDFAPEYVRNNVAKKSSKLKGASR